MVLLDGDKVSARGKGGKENGREVKEEVEWKE